MISFFRSLFNTKLGVFVSLAFVILMGLAFTLSDVTNTGSFGGISSGNVARVGGQNISTSELGTYARRLYDQEKQQNPTLDYATFIEKGGLDKSLDQIISMYAMQSFGEKYGLGVSNRLIDSEISKIPNIRNMNGQFDPEALKAFLNNIQLSEKEYRQILTRNFHGSQMAYALSEGVKAPSSLVLPYASLEMEKRTGVFAAVPSSNFLPKAPPSDAVLSKFYRDNAVRFTIPEQRAISYAIFDTTIIAGKAKPSEADIASYYEKNKAQYAASQLRSISRVVTPTEAAAKALVDKASGGQSLTAIAQAAGFSVSKETDISRKNLTSSASKEVADAVFASAQGSIAKPAKGQLGWYVVKVDALKNMPARTLVQVSAEIAKKLETDRAAEALNEVTSNIEDQLADGVSIDDVAKENGLKVETTPKLFANGANPADRNYRPVAEMEKILPAAFEMEKDSDAQLIEIIAGEKFAVAAIAELKEATPPPLAEVKNEVTQIWALSEGAKKAKAVAEQIQKAVSAGKSLQQAVSDSKVAMPPVQTITGKRSDLRQEGRPLPPQLTLLFSMKKGSAKILPAPQDQGYFIIQATEVTRGDASGQADLIRSAGEQISAMLGQELVAQFFRAAANDVGVERNKDAIAEMKKRLTQRDGQ